MFCGYRITSLLSFEQEKLYLNVALLKLIVEIFIIIVVVVIDLFLHLFNIK